METAPLAIAIIPPPLEKFAPALGDVTRWQIVALLAAGEPLLVGEIAAKLGRDAGLISKHLARLRDKGLVSFRREGTTLFYRVADAKITHVLKTLKTHYC